MLQGTPSEVSFFVRVRSCQDFVFDDACKLRMDSRSGVWAVSMACKTRCARHPAKERTGTLSAVVGRTCGCKLMVEPAVGCDVAGVLSSAASVDLSRS